MLLVLLERCAIAYTFKADIRQIYKCYHTFFKIIICKYFNISCFIAIAYTTVDRLHAVFIFNLYNDESVVSQSARRLCLQFFDSVWCVWLAGGTFGL